MTHTNMGAAIPATFEPAAWLAHFETVGGGYALTDSGLHLWIIPGDRRASQLSQARRMVSHLTPTQRAALTDHLAEPECTTPAKPIQMPCTAATLSEAGLTGDIHDRSDEMNIMTRIQAEVLNNSFRRPPPKADNPTSLAGIDLTKARPIAEVINELAPMRNLYPAAFMKACKESGIDISVIREASGQDHLVAGCPVDGQEDLRRERLDALCAQLLRGSYRRRDVIGMLNAFGHFVDRQPFASIEEAASAYLQHGGRIWLTPDGRCEETMSHSPDVVKAEGCTGYPLRRLVQRYKVTLNKPGAREVMAAHVRDVGKLHKGSGCMVLDAEGRCHG